MHSRLIWVEGGEGIKNKVAVVLKYSVGTIVPLHVPVLSLDVLGSLGFLLSLKYLSKNKA